jgi:hypothetical protein
MVCANSSDVLPTVGVAMARNFSFTSAICITLRISVSSFLTMAAGVPARTKMPLHSCTSTPVTPLSAIVGTSGRSSSRLSAVTASARTTPPFTCGVVGGGSVSVNSACWLMTATSISLLLL